MIILRYLLHLNWFPCNYIKYFVTISLELAFYLDNFSYFFSHVLTASRFLFSIYIITLSPFRIILFQLFPKILTLSFKLFFIDPFRSFVFFFNFLFVCKLFISYLINLFSLNILHQEQSGRMVQTAMSTLEKFYAHVIVVVVMNDVLGRCKLQTSLKMMSDSKLTIARLSYASIPKTDYVRSSWTPGALIASEQSIDDHYHFQTFEGLT
jgi:hypothetical protein